LQGADSDHFAAITDPKQVADLLRAIDCYQGSFAVICALKLASLVFVRPGELRAAEWGHINLESKEWRYRQSPRPWFLGLPHKIIPIRKYVSPGALFQQKLLVIQHICIGYAVSC
jgi:integrase